MYTGIGLLLIRYPNPGDPYGVRCCRLTFLAHILWNTDDRTRSKSNVCLLDYPFQDETIQSAGKLLQGCAGTYVSSDYPNGSLLAKLNMDDTFQGSFMASPKFKMYIFIVLLNLCSHLSLSTLKNTINAKPKGVTYRDVDPLASSIQSLRQRLNPTPRVDI